MTWREEVARRVEREFTAAPTSEVAVLAGDPRALGALGGRFPRARRIRLGAAAMLPQRARATRVPEPPVRDVDGFRGRSPTAGAPSPLELALTGTCCDAAVLWMLGVRAVGEGRRRVLGELLTAIRPGGMIVVVDHNRPRRRWQRTRNRLWCLLRGIIRDARVSYPTAREVRAAGFEDVTLRLAFGERVQIVCGRRPAADRASPAV
jgi:hypothetical protein